eukprot:6214210-Amphidinium_carterae.1
MHLLQGGFECARPMALCTLRVCDNTRTTWTVLGHVQDRGTKICVCVDENIDNNSDVMDWPA